MSLHGQAQDDDYHWKHPEMYFNRQIDGENMVTSELRFFRCLHDCKQLDAATEAECNIRNTNLVPVVHRQVYYEAIPMPQILAYHCTILPNILHHFQKLPLDATQTTVLAAPIGGDTLLISEPRALAEAVRSRLLQRIQKKKKRNKP